MFNGNALKKKVLCITDKDFSWINEEIKFKTWKSYSEDKPTHIEKLTERFAFEEFKIVTQKCGGRTFEDELFLANSENIDTAVELLKIALPESLHETIMLLVAEQSRIFTYIFLKDAPNRTLKKIFLRLKKKVVEL